MSKIDWSKFKFISRKDQWFLEGTECKLIVDYGITDKSSIVESNGGLFSGLTNEGHNGYTGVLPREDEEGCPFNEFDIYIGDALVNKLTYGELYSKLRSDKIDDIIQLYLFNP